MGSELKSSCLHSEDFTNCVTSPAHNFTFIFQDLLSNCHTVSIDLPILCFICIFYCLTSKHHNWESRKLRHQRLAYTGRSCVLEILEPFLPPPFLLFFLPAWSYYILHATLVFRIRLAWLPKYWVYMCVTLHLTLEKGFKLLNNSHVSFWLLYNVM